MFGWKAFLETLLLQNKCPAGTHKWTKYTWKIHPKISYNLKWKLLNAFITCTYHQSSPYTQVTAILQRPMEVQCEQPWLTQRAQLGLKQTCLACDTGRARGDEHTTLASEPHWPAFAEGHGSQHQQNSPCVIQPQSTCLGQKAKVWLNVVAK